MAAYHLISADSHIVEPPDLYTSRVQPQFRDRAPRMKRQKTPTGSEYDAWFIDDMQVGTLGAVIQAGQRFEDPSQIDFLGVWGSVRKAAYDPHAMIEELAMDGVWGPVCSRARDSSGIAFPTAPCSLTSAAPTTTG
jgi:hypothetical protein